MKNTWFNYFLSYYTYFYIIFTCFACGSSTPKEPPKVSHIKLSQVWLARAWQSIAALDQRGPLSVFIARDHELEKLGLESIPWIKASLIQELNLKTTVDIKKQQRTIDYPLLIDGMANRIELNFTALDSTIHPFITNRFDLIIPAKLLFEIEDENRLVVNQEGSLSIKSLNSRDYDQNMTTNPNHLKRLDRYKSLWDHAKAYQAKLIAYRIDQKDKMEIRWIRPKIPLPKDLWLVTSTDSLKPSKGSKIAAHIGLPKKYIPTPHNTINTTIPFPDLSSITNTQKSTCTFTMPCPLYLYDIIRVSKNCTSDLCTQRLEDFRVNLKPRPKTSDTKDAIILKEIK